MDLVLGIIFKNSHLTLTRKRIVAVAKFFVLRVETLSQQRISNKEFQTKNRSRIYRAQFFHSISFPAIKFHPGDCPEAGLMFELVERHSPHIVESP